MPTTTFPSEPFRGWCRKFDLLKNNRPLIYCMVKGLSCFEAVLPIAVRDWRDAKDVQE
jgi:hypothetical protein